MSNKKGQALLEFVVILPVMLLLIFGIVDSGRIIYEKNNLENMVSEATLLYENDYSTEEIKNIISKKENKEINVYISNSDGYSTINLSLEIKPITPGLNYLNKKVFNLRSSRVIKNE